MPCREIAAQADCRVLHAERIEHFLLQQLAIAPALRVAAPHGLAHQRVMDERRVMHALARRLILSGPADEFQRQELVRILDDIPGVLEVRWDAASLPQEPRRTR